MAWQSGHELMPSLHRPARRNAAVHHWMFQKFQMARSRSKNTRPNMSNKSPPSFMHFLHPIISITSSIKEGFEYIKFLSGI